MSCCDYGSEEVARENRLRGEGGEESAFRMVGGRRGELVGLV